MEVDGAHADVVSGRMMLGDVVAEVFMTWSPGDEELALFRAVLDPIETHVYCLGPLLIDIVDGEVNCCSVVW